MSFKVSNVKLTVFYFQEKKQKLDIAHVCVGSAGGTGISLPSGIEAAGAQFNPISSPPQ